MIAQGEEFFTGYFCRHSVLRHLLWRDDSTINREGGTKSTAYDFLTNSDTFFRKNNYICKKTPYRTKRSML